MKFALLSTLALTVTAAVLSRREVNPKAGPAIAAANRTSVQIALSKTLGALVIGSSRNQADLSYLCKTDSLYADWTKFTSVPANDALRAELCNAAAGPIPGIPGLINTIQQSASDIFTNQILSSFAQKHGIPLFVIYEYLCKNLDYDKLNAFGVVTTKADPIASVCKLANTAQAYDPNTPVLVANQTLVTGYQETTMTLTARTIFLAAATQDNREYICDHYDSYKPFIAGIGWNTDAFYHELCNSLPLDTEYDAIASAIELYSSADYAKQLRGVSKVKDSEWKNTLSGWFNAKQMAYVSLDIATVKSVFSSDIP
ncbi:hypothetical protein EJ05DRAFT_499143 [Pseudovirgaria hyperparasitica]|uniref:Uncharacterized protein n=1 Tax=Pseudovirgaria hyperparasitica TaxID=470096 RepID=A0A6A6WB97_9PEZI|nr:uncharacterized protein EJ05DRAFT_499143 [Pseudovirgaria hyperparasitica]KAF2759953.1 hypothetical protein EJ05DRAFT_499143 [Pseudovirgaria hyperparasitica]